MPKDDDKRVAVGFSVTLSGQLMAASMATLAVEGAFVWYALDSRQPITGFIFFAALAAILIAFSIFNAGKGITKARDAGFDGAWDLAKGKQEFNRQAGLLIGALVMLCVMFSLSGQSKEPVVEKKVEALRIQVALMRTELDAQPALREAAKNEMVAQLDKVSREIQCLRADLSKSQKQRCKNDKTASLTSSGAIRTEASHRRLAPSRPAAHQGVGKTSVESEDDCGSQKKWGR